MKNSQLNLHSNKGFNMNIIDAHTHIDYITHEHQDDVAGCIVCATNESDWNELVKLSNKDKNVYCAFGVHPWFVENVKDGFGERLENLLKTNNNFMVGEIGLDKYKPNMDKQIDVFIKQLNIAIRLKRNIFLHCVGAWDKILHILKQYKKSELPIIVAHDFNGNDEIIKQLLENYNIMFSFNKIDKDHDIHRIQQIPNDKILVESDGKNNILLKENIEKISKIKHELNISDIIYNNIQKVLKNG